MSSRQFPEVHRVDLCLDVFIDKEDGSESKDQIIIHLEFFAFPFLPPVGFEFWDLPGILGFFRVVRSYMAPETESQNVFVWNIQIHEKDMDKDHVYTLSHDEWTHMAAAGWKTTG